ncbi:MAG: hypothetical protein J6V44_09030 [Methanobrevibacter sp.]|nr:hypothetical protein [Methanobrevibacter sp.]
MATKGNTFLTLKDYYSQLEGGQITSTIIDMNVSANPMLEDAVVIECNDGTTHKTTVRNGLPEPQFRKFYQGVKATKGDYTQVTDGCAMLADYSHVDKDLAELNGNTNQFRLNEAEAHIQGMNNTVQENVIYGNKGVNSSAFDGFATRYNTISEEAGTIGYQVLDAGGTGTTNTSIYLIGWGERASHFIYPKGSKAGLEHKDLGEVTVKDDDGNEYQALKDYFSWKLGLSVRNYRASARIANIDVAKLDTEDAANLIKLMVKAFHRADKFAKLTKAKLVWYVNTTIFTYLHLQALESKNVRLTYEEVAGQPVIKFLGIPVKLCDQILDTEDTVKKAK